MEIAFLKTAGSILLTYGSHYVTTKLYNGFCVPDGVYGFFQGLLNTGSPVCSLALKYMATSQDSYSTMITMGISRMIIDILIKKSFKLQRV
jgi:hypothetical protein